MATIKAVLNKEYGFSTIIISEGLGHSSEKTTRIYLKEFYRSVIDNIHYEITSFLSE